MLRSLAFGLPVLVVSVWFTAPAHAYRLYDDVIPQPRIRYYVALDDWRKPMRRVVKALNRARVGVRLVRAEIPEQASIQIGRLDRGCRAAGVDATTQTIEGGYSAIYLPRGCKPTKASILAAHELGHALGLKHDSRRCALMNSSGTGKLGVPTQCYGADHPWLRRPFRADDLAGLRRLYRNTAPRVTLSLTGPASVPVGTPVTFSVKARDRERNLSRLKADYGDGATEERDAAEAPPSSHTFTTPGTYRIRVTALDLYGKRDTASVTVTVTDA